MRHSSTGNRCRIPAHTKKQNNPAFNRGRSTALAELWSDSTVLGILKKQVYTGTTVQHVNEKISYKSKRLRRLPPERRAVVQGTHAAVIDTETWEAVQRKLAEGGAEQRQGRQAGRAGGKMPLRAVRRKAAKQIRPCGKIPAVPHPRCGPGALPGCEHPRDEAAQCVLEALQDCMARYLDREYLARHLASAGRLRRTGRNSCAAAPALAGTPLHASAPAAKRCA